MCVRACVYARGCFAPEIQFYVDMLLFTKKKFSVCIFPLLKHGVSEIRSCIIINIIVTRFVPNSFISFRAQVKLSLRRSQITLPDSQSVNRLVRHSLCQTASQSTA